MDTVLITFIWKQKRLNLTFGNTVTTDADQASDLIQLEQQDKCLLKLRQKQRYSYMSSYNQLLHGNPTRLQCIFLSTAM